MTSVKGRKAALTAWTTRRNLSAWAKAHAAEAASKDAFKTQFEQHGWRVAFFEGPTGSPRTGIIDAVAFRLDRKNPDLLDLRLVQLKGGKAGTNAKEIGRLKKAVTTATVNWLIAEFDFDDGALHLLPTDPEGSGRTPMTKQMTQRKTDKANIRRAVSRRPSPPPGAPRAPVAARPR